MRIGILAKDDGIIHQNAQGHDEGKQRDHVNRVTMPVQDKERTHKGDRYANGHPEGEAKIQKESKTEKHKEYALGAVPGKQVDPILNHPGEVSPYGKLNPFRHCAPVRFHIIPYGPGNLYDVFLTGPGDLHHRHPLAVKAPPLICILKTVDDITHITQPDDGPVPVRDERNIFKLATRIALALGPDQHIPPGGLDHTTGQIKAGGAHSLRHPVKGETVSSQILLRDLNRYLIVPNTQQVCLGDRLGIGQVIPDFFGHLSEFSFRHIPVNGQTDDRFSHHQFYDHRLFSIFRECVDTIHLGFNLIQNILHLIVRVHIEFSQNRPTPF